MQALEAALHGEEISLYEDMCANQDSGMRNERFLKTPLCNAAPNRENAIKVALELVSLMNGAVMVFLRDLLKHQNITAEDLFSSSSQEPSFEFHLPNRIQPLILKHAFHDGHRLTWSPFLEPEYSMLCDFSTETNGVTFQASKAVSKSSGGFVSKLIEAAKRNQGVYILLKLFSFEVNWITLYKVFETLETLMGKTRFNKSISKDERDALKNSANNFSLTYFASRHGLKKEGKQNNARAATLQEAFATMQKATEVYLRKNYLN